MGGGGESSRRRVRVRDERGRGQVKEVAGGFGIWELRFGIGFPTNLIFVLYE